MIHQSNTVHKHSLERVFQNSQLAVDWATYLLLIHHLPPEMTCMQDVIGGWWYRVAPRTS